MKPQIRNIALDLILTILLCGLWNVVVQIKQMEALNFLLKNEKYVFWKIYLLSLLTCGFYLVIYEYRKATDLARLAGKEGDSDPVLAVILAILGLSIVYDAIAQDKINALLASDEVRFG